MVKTRHFLSFTHHTHLTVPSYLSPILSSITCHMFNHHSLVTFQALKEELNTLEAELQAARGGMNLGYVKPDGEFVKASGWCRLGYG